MVYIANSKGARTHRDSVSKTETNKKHRILLRIALRRKADVYGRWELTSCEMSVLTTTGPV